MDQPKERLKQSHGWRGSLPKGGLPLYLAGLSEVCFSISNLLGHYRKVKGTRYNSDLSPVNQSM